jgi:hypothetical protein
MVKHDQSKFLSIIFWLFIATCVAVNWFHNGRAFAFDKIINDLSTAVTIDTFICTLFVTYLWKLRIFKGWLVQIPDISGVWQGVINSNWVNPATGSATGSIPASIKVSQNFFYINIKITTDQMESISSAGTFDIDKERGISRLWYSYTSTPNVAVRPINPIHFGTTLLTIDPDNPDVMSGEYWTSRQTIGTISLTRVK